MLLDDASLFLGDFLNQLVILLPWAFLSARELEMI